MCIGRSVIHSRIASKIVISFICNSFVIAYITTINRINGLVTQLAAILSCSVVAGFLQPYVPLIGLILSNIESLERLKSLTKT